MAYTEYIDVITRISQTGDIKKTIKEFNLLNKTTRKFRMELLSVMFGAMAISRTFDKLLQPMDEAAGLTDYWNAILLENTTDAIEPAMEAMDAMGSVMAATNEATGGQLGTTLLLGKAMGDSLTTLSQFELFMDGVRTTLEKMGFERLVDILDKISATKLIKSVVEWSSEKWDENIKPLIDTVKDAIFKTTVEFYESATSTLSKIVTTVFPGFSAGQAAITVAISFSIGALVATVFWKWVKENLTDKFGPAIGTPLAAALIIGAATALGIIGAVLAATIIGAPIGVPLVLAAGALGALGAGMMVAAQGFQHGGIVTRPTTALIGERGPEAVIPLDRIGSIGGINVTINTNTIGGNVDMIAREVADKFAFELSRVRY